MKKYAIIKDGVVVNVIEYESQPSTPPAGFDEGHQAFEANHVSVGWNFADGTFTDPNPLIVVEMPATKSLTDVILENPTELAKLKQALGI